jgi:ubiquinone/menaquinone biosynthesis C-methylase UbiE
MERIAEQETIALETNARRFNQVMGKGPVQHEYRQLAESLVHLDIPEGAQVLDIGTGPGFVALEIAAILRQHAHVTGLDLSDAMLVIAAENSCQRDLTPFVAWQKGDAGQMPFDTAQFDAIVSSGSLHHWENPIQIFNEINRVLKADGKLIIRDSKRQRGAGLPQLLAWGISLTLPPDFRHHYWGSIASSYTPAELQQLLNQSQLQHCRIVADWLDLMIIKE